MVTVSVPEIIKPDRLKMSYEEYLYLAGESTIAEWVSGEVIRYMPPTDKHQDVSRFLSVLMDLFIGYFDLGILRYAPFEVKLWPDGPSREPDIFFVSKANVSKLSARRYSGGPDLVIEIISRASATEDRVRKFTEYERAGIREYWLVDPRPRQQQCDFYVLDPDQIYQPAAIDENGIYRSTVLPGFWLAIDWLWKVTMPNPQLALAEIMLSSEGLPAEARATFQALYNLLTP
jgi:Uma2 family endonuclease